MPTSVNPDILIWCQTPAAIDSLHPLLTGESSTRLCRTSAELILRLKQQGSCRLVLIEAEQDVATIAGLSRAVRHINPQLSVIELRPPRAGQASLLTPRLSPGQTFHAAPQTFSE